MGENAERSLSTFDQAIRTDPDLVEPRFNRAIALLKLQRFADAEAAFGQLLEREDQSFRAAAAYHRALALDRMGEFAAAEQWLQHALAADRDLDSALLYLGVVREKQQNFTGAGDAYKRYLVRQPQSIVGMLRFGICAHRARFADTARKYLQQVVALAPSSLEAAEARKILLLYD
jgi:tetratricopeptide (TPR) repeat protein